MWEIEEMNKVSYNLLIILDSLLREAHVTEAGKKVGLSQSAMSCALRQLREVYQDELLERIPGHKQMRLTAFAKTLIEPVTEALAEIKKTFAITQTFDPKAPNRTFSIAVSDYAAAIILPALQRRLNQLDTEVKIMVRHIATGATPLLEENGSDITILCFRTAIEVSKSFVQRELFRDPVICLMSADHPLAKQETMTQADLMNYKQVLLSMNTPLPTSDNYCEAVLRKNKCLENVIARLPFATATFNNVSNSEFLCFSSQKLSEVHLKKYNLVMKKPPFKIDDYVVSQYWHRRYDNDPGHVWFRQIISDVSNKA